MKSLGRDDGYIRKEPVESLIVRRKVEVTAKLGRVIKGLRYLRFLHELV